MSELCKCKECKREKPIEEFLRVVRRGNRYNGVACIEKRSRCRNCRTKVGTNHFISRKDMFGLETLRDPEKSKSSKYKSRFGITFDQAKEMLALQGGVCAVYKTEKPEKRKMNHAKDRWPWCVDHCHKTGAVRGILCHHCNTLLGVCREKQSVLLGAMEYISNSKRGELPGMKLVSEIRAREEVSKQAEADELQEALAGFILGETD